MCGRDYWAVEYENNTSRKNVWLLWNLTLLLLSHDEKGLPSRGTLLVILAFLAFNPIGHDAIGQDAVDLCLATIHTTLRDSGVFHGVVTLFFLSILFLFNHHYFYFQLNHCRGRFSPQRHSGQAVSQISVLPCPRRYKHASIIGLFSIPTTTTYCCARRFESNFANSRSRKSHRLRLEWPTRRLSYSADVLSNNPDSFALALFLLAYSIGLVLTMRKQRRASHLPLFRTPVPRYKHA